MAALRSFGLKGGVITTGDDAGFIYSLYGFGLVRELELHEEAGFHPLEVITHATVNGAALLGMEALGLIDSLEVADELVHIRETVRPDPSAAATYASLMPVFSNLYEALLPTFVSLRRLGPSLPVDKD